MPKVIKNWNLSEFSLKKGIYRLCITDKHSYVGSAVNLRIRVLRHRTDLIRGDHDNQIMQRSFNKYGYDALGWEILEVCDINISYNDLLKREKYYIDLYNPDMNIKRDPVTQQCCPTTSSVVYQFDQFGKLIKKWNCMNEAARQLGADNCAAIRVCCINRKRQRIFKGYLWDYSPTYTGELYVLYVFDLLGNFLSKHCSTKDIYLKYFSNKKQKTVLSQLKKKIDSKIPYENIYISTDKNFKINENYKPRYD